MPTLITLGFIGIGAIATSTLLNRMASGTPDSVPRFGAFDARPVIAGLGLVGSLILPGLGAMLAAAVGTGALLNMVMPTQPMLSGSFMSQFGSPMGNSYPSMS